MNTTDGPSGRTESAEERADRNWNELLQELRVTQTGTQILTGFLLTLPFQQRFTELRSDQVIIYLCLVCLGLITTMFAVAPVSIHRLLFQRRRKPEIVRVANLIARFALASLALLIAGIVLFVFDIVVGREPAMIAAGAAAVMAAVLWLAVPLRVGRRSGGGAA